MLWFTFNIMLPLTPVLIKLFITLFGEEDSVFVSIIDSTELLYFNLVICVILLYELIRQEAKSGLEYWIEFGAALIIIFDIVLLTLTYVKLGATERIRVASLIVSILVPIVASVRKYKELKEKHKNNKGVTK